MSTFVNVGPSFCQFTFVLSLSTISTGGSNSSIEIVFVEYAAWFRLNKSSSRIKRAQAQAQLRSPQLNLELDN